MKKFVLIALALTVLLAGCTPKKEDAGDNSDPPQTTTASTTQLPDNSQTSPPVEEEWGVVYHCPLANAPFEINFPNDNGRDYSTGRISYFDDIVVFVDKETRSSPGLGVKVEDAKKPSDILKVFEITFLSTVKIHPQTINQKGIEITRQQDVKIGLYDCNKSYGEYTFTPLGKDDYISLSFVSYAAFLSTGCPFYLVVLDNSEEQSQSALIEEIADKMISTLREYEENW